MVDKPPIVPLTYSVQFVASCCLQSSLALSQGVDNSGDVYRATYTAFRCSSVSGTLGAHERVQVGAGVLPGWLRLCAEPSVSVTGVPALILYMFCQVPITFLPRDRGDYAQFWDLECHPASEPQQKSRVRFQLCGTVSTPSLPIQKGCVFKQKPKHTLKRKSRKTPAPLAVAVRANQGVN